MNIVLFQPDIALNVGACIRFCACLDIHLHIIEPCGFPFDLKKIKASSLDYINHVKLTRHQSFESFKTYKEQNPGKLYLFTTKTNKSFYEAKFQKNDYLLYGNESQGAPKQIHDYANDSLTIKMNSKTRSLNLVTSIAMTASEAIRQTHKALLSNALLSSSTLIGDPVK
jgi:tRNA (cytidine/uridine-2'-O-)-methyltransferase